MKKKSSSSGSDFKEERVVQPVIGLMEGVKGHDPSEVRRPRAQGKERKGRGDATSGGKRPQVHRPREAHQGRMFSICLRICFVLDFLKKR